MMLINYIDIYPALFNISRVLPSQYSIPISWNRVSAFFRFSRAFSWRPASA